MLPQKITVQCQRWRSSEMLTVLSPAYKSDSENPDAYQETPVTLHQRRDVQFVCPLKSMRNATGRSGSSSVRPLSVMTGA
jgi:hypothetical protein